MVDRHISHLTHSSLKHRTRLWPDLHPLIIFRSLCIEIMFLVWLQIMFCFSIPFPSKHFVPAVYHSHSSKLVIMMGGGPKGGYLKRLSDVIWGDREPLRESHFLLFKSVTYYERHVIGRIACWSYRNSVYTSANWKPTICCCIYLYYKRKLKIYQSVQ